jgi:hypothetical protein
LAICAAAGGGPTNTTAADAAAAASTATSAAATAEDTNAVIVVIFKVFVDNYGVDIAPTTASASGKWVLTLASLSPVHCDENQDAATLGHHYVAAV